jgi:protein-tyrosine-phosphatase
MKKIVFICTGNTCRSPMAEGLCRSELINRGLTGITVCSAGMAAETGSPPSQNAIIAMDEKGIDISSHRAVQATAELLDDADLIICMSDWQRQALSGRYRDRVTVIPGEVPDPFGGDLDRYRACRDQLAEAIARIADKIA